MDAQTHLDDMRRRALEGLDASQTLDNVNVWERQFLGPKGELTLFLRSLASLPPDQRPIAGRWGNALRAELTTA